VAFTYLKVKSAKCLCLLPVVLVLFFLEFGLVYITAPDTKTKIRCALTKRAGAFKAFACTVSTVVSPETTGPGIKKYPPSSRVVTERRSQRMASQRLATATLLRNAATSATDSQSVSAAATAAAATAAVTAVCL